MRRKRPKKAEASAERDASAGMGRGMKSCSDAVGGIIGVAEDR